MGNPRTFSFMAHIIQFYRMICRRNVATDSRPVREIRGQKTLKAIAPVLENVIV